MALYPTLLFWNDTEVEFVVHLKNHLTADAFFLETLEDADHRHLDDVGSSTLDRCIDGIALSKAPYGGIAAVDVGQIAAAVEEGLHIAFSRAFCLLSSIYSRTLGKVSK